MTAQKYKTTMYQAEHTAFGGKIYDYDYNGRTSMCDIASRIEADRKFDERCRQHLEQKKNREGSHEK